MDVEWPGLVPVLALGLGSEHASEHEQPGPGQQQAVPAAVPYRPRGCLGSGTEAKPSSILPAKESMVSSTAVTFF